MSPALAIPAPSTPARPEAVAAPSGPLSPEDMRVLAEAKQRRKKLNRASGIAAFNTWTFVAMSGCSLLAALFSPISLIAVASFGVLAWNESRGRRRIRALDLRGPATLGWNQLGFCGLIAAYCVYQLAKAVYGPAPYADQIAQTPELGAMLEPVKELILLATIAAYGALLVLGVGMQGLMAWYYFSRRACLRQYLEHTPAWVVELDRRL
ncbi:MAG: hypothetical protein AAGH88_12835 [Planctomycetota bacterium]